jgi:putative component of membrane protein insertase Oxa1/YidC/SpoIIIJ protein YidD
MTAALSLSPLACRLIEVYQRYISPRKGFCCAYRVRYRRRDSCSQYARRAISKLGLLPGVQLLRRRFDKCRHASQVLEYEPRREKRKQARRDSNWYADCGSHCDPGVPVDACDCAGAVDPLSGCDVGGCDLSL